MLFELNELLRAVRALVCVCLIALPRIINRKYQFVKQIAMSFEKFDLINKNDCINNFIDVYGNDTNVSNP